MERIDEIERLKQAFEAHPIVALLGPRQCGKTTLARKFWAENAMRPLPDPAYFDLEDPTHEARLTHPKLALENLTGLVVIDEIQRAPELFKVLRVLVDRPGNAAKFLILGSASSELIRQSSESLAGRLQYLELTPFSLSEVSALHLTALWQRGGFPKSFLAQTDSISLQWRNAYIRTYLEQDIPALGIQIPPPALRRFWTMLAHYHGQIFNASEIGRSLGVADTTARRYLDILSGTFMIRQLQPWHANLKKRQVKSPKIYFRDSGLFHRLLGLGSDQEILLHPKLGASWEGFALEETIRALRVPDHDAYFWSVHGQAELDLLIHWRGKRFGFEVKYTDKPLATRSLRTAMDLLQLDRAWVLYPGSEAFPLEERIEALPLAKLAQTFSSNTNFLLRAPEKPENLDHKRQPLPDTKVHPWRLCPYGEHARETHSLHVSTSKKNPEGVTTRHYHCVKNPDYKDALYPHEIEQIAGINFGSLVGAPKPYNFKRPNGNDYDSLIGGWTRYWNEVLLPSEALDPNIVKALIFTESRFIVKTVNVTARGLMQLVPTAVKALKDYEGELHDHFVILTRNDLFAPNLNICGGIRWLFHKKKLQEGKTKRTITWMEAVAAYKGRTIGSKEMDIFEQKFTEIQAAK